LEIFLSTLTLALIVFTLVNEFFQQRVNVSPMPSMTAVRRKMIEIIPDEITGDIIEFGSGFGGLSALASNAYADNKVLGYELSIFPYIISRIRQYLSKNNLEFIRKDFHGVDLSNSCVILCYLSNPIMAKLEKKLLEELPKGALIISSTFYMPNWEEEDIFTVEGIWNTKIFVYRKK